MEKRKLPYNRYSREFRQEAVKLVAEGGLSVPQAATRLSIPTNTLRQWIKAAERGTLQEVGGSARQPNDLEIELARVRRELETVKMERDILKKAAAYFAKESMPGTR